MCHAPSARKSFLCASCRWTRFFRRNEWAWWVHGCLHTQRSTQITTAHNESAATTVPKSTQISACLTNVLQTDRSRARLATSCRCIEKEVYQILKLVSKPIGLGRHGHHNANRHLISSVPTRSPPHVLSVGVRLKARTQRDFDHTR